MHLTVETALTALSPLDGRYADKLDALREHFSEFALIRSRVRIEIAWLLALADEPAIAEVPAVRRDGARGARGRGSRRSALADAARVKAIERTTNHDVKAVEYWLKERFAGVPEVARVARVRPFRVHVRGHQQPRARRGARARRGTMCCCRRCRRSHESLRALAHEHADVAMLARTHGQPATPTTLGKEMANVVATARARRSHAFERVPLKGKINGAVGNYNAHVAAYPDVDWEQLAARVVDVARARVQSVHDADRAARLHGGVLRRASRASTRS